MILSPADISDIILNNPNKGLINKGHEYCKRARFHLYGEGKDHHIEQIPTHEKKEDFDIRKKYTPTNKPFYARLGRPIDKVFSAKGGSFYLNLSDEQTKRANNLLSNVVDGLSVKKYVKEVWSAHMNDDPFGVVLMEIMTQQEAALAKQQGRPRTYPTYQPITDIYDYEPRGNRLEYLVLNLSKQFVKNNGLDEKGTYYRVIDDAADYIVKKEEKQATIINSLTLPNIFGFVPAIRNSDLMDPIEPKAVVSLFDSTFEIAEQYLLKGSIKAIHDFHHGFPKLIAFPSTCHECKGSGLVEGDNCKTCNGSGRVVASKNPAQITMLPDPTKRTKEDQQLSPSDWMAWLSPDKVFHEIATADREMLESMAFETLWGNKPKARTQGMGGPEVKTATEVMDDMQPQADRLHVISDMADARTKFIVDCIVKIEISPNYQGCSYSGGRRYLLEGPDVIWEKYLNAKTKGAPQNVLDELLNEFYEEKFESDRIGLEIAQKLMYVEPFVHMTIQQVQTLNVSEEAYKAKLYYSDWLAQVSEPELMVKTTAELREGLAAFVSTKTIAKPEPKQLNPAA